MSDVTDLIERLRAGVPEVGLHEDNNTELFDIENANETMAEAADALATIKQTDAVEAERRGALAHELAKRKLLDFPIGEISSDELWGCIDAAIRGAK